MQKHWRLKVRNIPPFHSSLIIFYAACPLKEEQLRFLLSPLASTSAPFKKVSVYSDRATSLCYDPERALYTFRGFSCQHTTSSVAQSGSRVESCAALEAFILYWCPQLGSIVDIANKSVILGRDVKTTLAKVTRATSIDLETLICHLCSAYPINTLESDRELEERFAKITLEESVPFLDPPVLRYQCNRCQRWVPYIARHRYDVKIGRFKGHSQDPISDSTAPQYFVLPLKSTGNSAGVALQRSLKVILAPGFIHDSDSKQKDSTLLQNFPAASSPPILDLIIPAYVHQLRWLEHLHRVKDSPKTFLEVKNLATRASKRTRGLFKDGTPGFVIEDFLLMLPGLVKEYFIQAESRISSAHSSVRELVTAA
jgi:hypothetical protein